MAFLLCCWCGVWMRLLDGGRKNARVLDGVDARSTGFFTSASWRVVGSWVSFDFFVCVLCGCVVCVVWIKWAKRSTVQKTRLDSQLTG